jgi:hypothetical protein
MKSLIIISKIRRLYKPLAVGRDHFRASRDRLWRSAFGTLAAPRIRKKSKKTLLDRYVIIINRIRCQAAADEADAATLKGVKAVDGAK